MANRNTCPKHETEYGYELVCRQCLLENERDLHAARLELEQVKRSNRNVHQERLMKDKTVMRLQDEITSLKSTIAVIQAMNDNEATDGTKALVEPTYETDFHLTLDKLTQALALIEQVPDYLYPYADDCIATAYNAIDNAIDTIKPIVEERMESN